MKPSVKSMLERIYRLFENRFNNRLTAWDRFIEFLAVDNDAGIMRQIRDNFDWLYEDKILRRTILSIYNPTKLKSDYHDHLGDLFFEIFPHRKVAKTDSLQRMTFEESRELALVQIGKTDAPLKILDPDLGTGRYLMAVHKIAPNAALFGVAKDIRLLRIAYTNFVIHGISGYLLNANPGTHDVSLETEEGIFNWQFANKWYPKMQELKTKMKTEKQLGLNRGHTMK